ncbi:hypothetical protein DCAR_0727209 [Daucus carota subsp. sativus]|uniref:DUF2232 domain-containing protein n=1 Tax=Daucus carota subsp. sativus TaxID=79200 RepID=A0AAF1B695_DAUCS|nr:PREDICTED: uncharacterized protein LOC108194126 [Daucus carota subsp. sativus]WOH07775.1 hypothetical protein DCAR_0727209 [Daucus carota subsp. sativus]
MNLSSRTEIHGLHPHPHPLAPSLSLQKPFVSLSKTPTFLSPRTHLSTSAPHYKPRNFRVFNAKQAWFRNNEQQGVIYTDDLSEDGEVYKSTLRLVECSMFAALGGLSYILSSSLAIENYFGCFFALPIVFSSIRWGLAAGRKTMVATAILLFVLAGPLKALTYLLMYGLLGLTMGSLWRLRASWGISVCLTAVARALGATCYVVMYSFLIRENILSLITINIHASLTYILTALGFITIPSMNTIYAIFGILLLMNCGFFVFLLHLLYSVFFTRLGMKESLRLPGWLDKAI